MRNQIFAYILGVGLLGLGCTNMTEANTVVEMQTSKGTIVLELNAEKAPKTVANFVRYVEEGFFDGTIFHRVIPDFMIQGGGFTPDMQQKTTHENIENEAGNGLKNVKGSIAMARTPHPHSASSQFFINIKDNTFLNYTAPTPQGWGYCVFGQVIEGMDVVDSIVGVATADSGGHQNVPVEPVLIEQARLR